MRLHANVSIRMEHSNLQLACTHQSKGTPHIIKFIQQKQACHENTVDLMGTVKIVNRCRDLEKRFSSTTCASFGKNSIS